MNIFGSQILLNANMNIFGLQIYTEYEYIQVSNFYRIRIYSGFKFSLNMNIFDAFQKANINTFEELV